MCHYFRYERLPLASEHWLSRRTHGDWFEFLAFQGANHRNAVTAASFEDLGLDERVVGALNRCGFKK